MLFRIVAFLCFACITPLCVAQKFDISGSVNYENLLNKPEDGATVTLTDGKGMVKTASVGYSGDFNFKRCCVYGSYQIKVEAVGYETKVIDFEVDQDISWVSKIIGIPLKEVGSKARTRQVDQFAMIRAQQALSFANNERPILDMLTLLDKDYTNEDIEYFECHQAAGIAYSKLGNLQKSLYHFDLAREALNRYPLYHTPGMKPLAKRLLALNLFRFINQTYLSNGLVESAITLLESTRKIADEEDDSYRVFHYVALSNLYSALGNEEKAINTMLVLKEYMERPIDGKASLEKQYGQIYKADKDDPRFLKKALKRQQEAFMSNPDLLKATENQMRTEREAARSAYLAELGKLYFKNFQYAKAIPYLRESDSLMTVIKQRAQASLSNLGANKIDTKELEAQVARMEESLKDPGVDESIKKINRESLGSLKLSLESIKKMSNAKPNDFSGVLKEIGSESVLLVVSYFKNGEADKAKQYANGLHGQAILAFLQGNYGVAQSLADQIITKLSTFSNDPFFGVPVKGLIESIEQGLTTPINAYAGNFSVSESASSALLQAQKKKLEENLILLSEAQRKQYFSAFFEKLNNYYSLLANQAGKDPSVIFHVLDKSIETKGLVLEATLKQEKTLRQLNNPTVASQIERAKLAKEKQAALTQLNQSAPTKALADSISHYDIVITDLQRKINSALPPINIFRGVTWKNVQAALVPGDALVEIVRINVNNFKYDKPVPQYWAFIIKPDNQMPTSVLIGQGEDFEKRNFRFYQNCIQSQLEDKASYGVYWKKIASNTQGVKRLFLSADGLYHLLNPATLYNPSSSRYVLDEVEIVRLSTARDLLDKKQKTAPASIVAVGNPDFSMHRKSSNGEVNKKVTLTEIAAATRTRSGYAPLPGTLQEIDIINEQAKMAGINSIKLEQQEATEKRIKSLNSPGILHLATHGEFDTQTTINSDLRSKLLLAGAGDSEQFKFEDYERYEDGLLTAYEVAQMDLNKTRLVVLSACETGLGEVQSGEGVWGLQRAFQLAGASEVMGSLWKISDEATVTYMNAFYSALLGGKTTSQAYKEAMQKTKSIYPQPYYWGAFVLSGVN
ncbi:MAG: CHAT domain-containing protein [Bacteroidota bacterium]|jgi:CHAT domain-containing protein|nr:CHAT domain-containing protein [Cytophagales bacterium]MCE2956713.1 CHAT domain-containing protein [Flammeovirgaceae bacterium]